MSKSSIGRSWDEVRSEIFTTEEISGVKQPIIARMERGSTSPQIDTVLKVLAPLGKTLAVVPMKKP